jgi:hypothetical protein
VKRLRKAASSTLTVLTVFLITAVPGWTQTGTTSISGRVTDPQGQIVPGATVTIVNPATGATRTTVTNDSGLYQVAALPPGGYNLTGELIGFRTASIENLEFAPVHFVAREEHPRRPDRSIESWRDPWRRS